MIEYPIERRARLLAEGINRNITLLRDSIAPPNARPPFKEQLSKPEALAFWKRNRHSPTGRDIIKNMAPEDLAELDLELSRME